MKILLVGNYEYDGQESMQRFARLLESAMSQAGHSVRLIFPEPIWGSLKPSVHGMGKWLGYIDKHLIFPKDLVHHARWADVVHICDHSNAHYTRFLQDRPHLVTCHDMLAIRAAIGEIAEHRLTWTGRLLQGLVRMRLGHAHHVCCVSETTRDDVVRLVGLPEEKVEVIHNGFNYPYERISRTTASERVSRLLGGDVPRYLLHVGNNSWYKNRLGVLKIYRQLAKTMQTPPKLIMAGRRFSEEMQRYVAEHGLEGSVCELLSPSNADLNALYSAAELMLFPSLEEGFGWPIIEAQAAGCPVVTTGKPPMSQIGGEAAVYLPVPDGEPEWEKNAAETVRRVLEESPDERAWRIEEGLRNAARFSTAVMIERYVRTYERIHRSTRPGSVAVGAAVPSPAC